MHFVRGTGASLGSNIGLVGLGNMHHHTPPIPVEPAVAPVPVLEQESVLDLSRRPSEGNTASTQMPSNENHQNQEQSDASNDQSSTT